MKILALSLAASCSFLLGFILGAIFRVGSRGDHDPGGDKGEQ